MKVFYNFTFYIFLIVTTAIITHYYTKNTNYKVNTFEEFLLEYESEINAMIEKYKNENLRLVNEIHQKPNFGWSKTQRTTLMSECIESKMSLGYCDCIIDVFVQEFDNLNDFNKKFDSVSEFLFKSIISGDSDDASKEIDFLEKISKCD